MAAYVVLVRLTPSGSKSLRSDPGRLAEVSRQVEQLGARIMAQYATLGEYDFVTIVEAPDNATVARIAAEISAVGTVKLDVHPAIALGRFNELLQIQPYRTEPHRWQTDAWARVARRAGRYFVMTRHVRRYCQPLEIERAPEVEALRGPAIIIANHSSHFDTPVVLAALPERLRSRATVAAAADRFYRSSKRTWWYSLFWNTFPIHRGGGKAALDYPMSLLKRGWSIVIYPEGGRSKSGLVQKFRHGVTIMAMQAGVPVVPVWIEGLRAIMPKGERTPRPGPVSAHIGAPVSLVGVTSVPEGTALLENAMRELAGLATRHAVAPGDAEVALAPGR
jgi:1-acyl-sn-glycerol-3-phosphate acyltransferase